MRVFRNSKGQEDTYDVFQALRENNHQPRLLYTAKSAFRKQEEIKTFQYKQKLKEFMATKPALPTILKRIINREGKARERINLTRRVDM